METRVQILGRLQIAVEFSIQRAEPDVGIMDDFVYDWFITEVNGRVPTPSSLNCLYRWVEAQEGVEELIEEACMRAANDCLISWTPSDIPNFIYN